MPRKKSPQTACIPSGYMYEYEGKPSGWKRSSDERWDTVMEKSQCGRVLGTRRVDGSPVTVVKVRGKVFAALSHYVRKGYRKAR